jgi:hypothetical protein
MKLVSSTCILHMLQFPLFLYFVHQNLYTTIDAVPEHEYYKI